MSAVAFLQRAGRHFVSKDENDWQRALVRLGILVALYVALLHADLIDLLRVWTTSTPYSHCVFLPAIIFWMVWQRRDGLARLEPQGWWPALIWIGSGALLWLLGWAGGLALFRHAALVVMAQGLIPLALGPAVARALAFPIFYAFFMIPIGTEAEPIMQILTAKMAISLLWLAGVPAQISGIFITTPNGYFRVAEACSGTGFLIAMAAYATLVAHLCFRQPMRRAIFILGSLLVCLLANGVRAFGIILIAYHTSVNSAVVVDHVVYGWLFFAFVILLVMALGWPFYDRSPFDPWFDPAELQGAAHARQVMSVGMMLAAAFVMAAPLIWSTASRAFATPLPPKTLAPQVRGWAQVKDYDPPFWAPHFAGADRIVITHYRDGQGRIVDLAQVLFVYQADGKELVGFGQGAASPDGVGDWTWASPAPAPAQARGDMLAGPQARGRLAFTYYRLGSTLTGQAGRVKLETLKTRLLGGDQRAMAILLSTTVPEWEGGPEQAQQTLADFLAAMGPVEEVADHSLAIR